MELRMTHPVPIGAFSLVLPILAVASLVLCTRWLLHAFQPPNRALRSALLTSALVLGLGLAARFAMNRHQYNADWQVVGWPVPAVLLERTILPGGKIFWKDWIGLNLLVGVPTNMFFWLLLPTAPFALVVSLFDRCRRSPHLPSS